MNTDFQIEVKKGEKLSVMIVDDEEDIRETLRMFLEMLDIFSFIVEAKDGGDAYRKCQNQSFDLIITDLMMPLVKGIDFIQNYKIKEKRENLAPTPFIILSGNITGIEVKRALGLGVKYALTKPCSADDFMSKIKEVLAKDKRNKVKVLKTGEEEPQEIEAAE